MNTDKPKVLITGLPGCGKTTLVENIIHYLGNRPDLIGFITREIREKGIRLGFELVSLDGRRAILSHVELKSPYRVGKYRVDLAGFEDFLESMSFFSPATRLVILDEIGRMECLSAKFREIVLRLVSGQSLLLATIALRGTPFMEKIRSWPGVKLLEITPSSRKTIQTEVLTIIKERL